MAMNDITERVLQKELRTLNERRLLRDHVLLEELMKLLSPDADEDWNKLLALCNPSYIAKVAGFSNVDLLCYLIEKALIAKYASSGATAKEATSLRTETALLGKDRDIDRYDLTPRKVRCISRGYRYDRKKKWEELLKAVKAFGDYKSNYRPISLLHQQETLDNLMEEPEAEYLIVGRTYTLTGLIPDIPLSNGKSSFIGLVFLAEYHSSPKAFINSPDGGFHSTLFEELKEVSVTDRMRHHDKYIAKHA